LFQDEQGLTEAIQGLSDAFKEDLAKLGLRHQVVGWGRDRLPEGLEDGAGVAVFPGREALKIIVGTEEEVAEGWRNGELPASKGPKKLLERLRHFLHRPKPGQTRAPLQRVGGSERLLEGFGGVRRLLERENAQGQLGEPFLGLLPKTS
jgi:hypothetical protein